MRRTALLVASFVLAFAGTALAAYKSGTYWAGSSTKDGVKMRVRQGSFSVSRISFIETCSNPNSGSFQERFTFVKGSEAKLKGKINKRGRFSGRYESSAGFVKVTGRVKGSKATVNATEGGSFTADDGQTYDCEGSHTFHAERLQVSAG